MVIFNKAPADFVMVSADVISKMTIKLSQMKIAQLGSLIRRTLVCLFVHFPVFMKPDFFSRK